MCSKAVCDVTKGTDPQLCVGSALSHQHPHCVEGPTDSLLYQEAVNRGLNMTFSGNVGRFFGVIYRIRLLRWSPAHKKRLKSGKTWSLISRGLFADIFHRARSQMLI